MQGEVKERAESRYGRAERKGQQKNKRQSGRANTHAHAQKWHATDEKQNNCDEGYSEGSVSCLRPKYEGKTKTAEVDHRQTKACVSENRPGTNNFVHGGDIRALAPLITARQPEHTVRPEVCCQSRGLVAAPLATATMFFTAVTTSRINLLAPSFPASLHLHYIFAPERTSCNQVCLMK